MWKKEVTNQPFYKKNNGTNYAYLSSKPLSYRDKGKNRKKSLITDFSIL
jgi:hypothetical protein